MINSNPFECINNLYNDTTESQVYDWSVSNNLISPPSGGDGSQCAIKPVLVNLKVAVVKIVLK